jgi:hypothetical protein
VTPLSPIEYALSFTVPSDAISADAWQLLISTTVNGVTVERWVQLAQAIFLTSTVKRGFTVRGATGQGQSADALPTVTVLRNNVAQGTSVTVNAVGSPNEGRYQFSFSVNAGWSNGDELQALIETTINTAPVKKLWHLGRIVDSSEVVINVTSLNILSDEQTIVLQDDEQTLTVACE